MRSNTIVGDRTHSRGMVVSRIVRANIPVKNGVVHLIDKPLMIVARSLFEYIMVWFINYTRNRLVSYGMKCKMTKIKYKVSRKPPYSDCWLLGKSAY